MAVNVSNEWGAVSYRTYRISFSGSVELCMHVFLFFSGGFISQVEQARLNDETLMLAGHRFKSSSCSSSSTVEQ